jgi:hypothetical protein
MNPGKQQIPNLKNHLHYGIHTRKWRQFSTTPTTLDLPQQLSGDGVGNRCA